MVNPKDILVTTTSTIEGVIVKQYLKPISAHLVAGTNLFSDFLGSFSDVFGGRSQTYQKQLTSLYNDAIERLKLSAHEIGANCIVGLNIDLDEISGKGKSMFMLTAIGTAVIIDDIVSKKATIDFTEKFENVGFDRIKTLQTKREILRKALNGTLTLDDENWDFIISNQISEISDYLLQLLYKQANSDVGVISDHFYKRTVDFVDGLPDENKKQFLYKSLLGVTNEHVALKFCKIIDELQLLDLDFVSQILQTNDFNKQKYGLKILHSDKPFYNKQDVEKLNSLIDLIKAKFPERGIRSIKKQLLSSKEKEIWTCECKNTNDIGYVCANCDKDIYGFRKNETKPSDTISNLEEKIILISEYVK